MIIGNDLNWAFVEQVYYYLLKLLLQPDEALKIPGLAYPLLERKSDLRTALDVLDRFPSRIDPIQVIEQLNICERIDANESIQPFPQWYGQTLLLLPPSTPLCQLQRFLQRSMESYASDKRELQLLRGLLYAEHLQVFNSIYKFQPQRTLISTHFGLNPSFDFKQPKLPPKTPTFQQILTSNKNILSKFDLLEPKFWLYWPFSKILKSFDTKKQSFDLKKPKFWPETKISTNIDLT